MARAAAAVLVALVLLPLLLAGCGDKPAVAQTVTLSLTLSPGTRAETVADKALRPVDAAMVKADGVVRVRTTASDGQLVVELDFGKPLPQTALPGLAKQATDAVEGAGLRVDAWKVSMQSGQRSAR